MTRLRRLIPPFLSILNITRIWWHTDHPAMSLALVGCLSGHLASWHWWHYASKCDHRVSLGDTNGHKHRPHPWEGAGHLSLLISLEKLTSWTGTGVLRELSGDNANHHMEIVMERWCLLKLRMSKYYHQNNRFNISVSGEFQTMWNQFESLLPSIHPPS